MTRARLPLAVGALAIVAVIGFLLVQATGARTATGVVVDVESVSLSEVDGFTLRSAAGDELRFRIGRLENPTQFPPSHLFEHRATAEPVIVHYRDDGGERVAYRIEDAPGG